MISKGLIVHTYKQYSVSEMIYDGEKPKYSRDDLKSYRVFHRK